MGERVEPLIEAAKQLSPAEREELVEALLGLNGIGGGDADDIAEWSRRADDVRNGGSEIVDADQAMTEVRAALKQRRGA